MDFLNHQSHEQPRIKPKRVFRQKDRINRSSFRKRRGNAHRKPNGGMTSVSSRFRGGAALVLLFLLRHSVQSVDLLLAADRGLELAAHIRRFAPEVWAPTEHRPLGTMRDAERTIGAKAPGSSGARPPPPILAPLLCKTLPHQRKDRFAYSVITLIAMNFLEMKGNEH